MSDIADNKENFNESSHKGIFQMFGIFAIVSVRIFIRVGFELICRFARGCSLLFVMVV